MDDSPFTVHARQLRAARVLLEWTAEDLAREADVGVATIRRLEGKDGTVKRLTVESYEKILRAFKNAHIKFIDEEFSDFNFSGRRFGVAIERPDETQARDLDVDGDIPF